ncbi:glutathione S-transferase [Nitrobacteraceae bacterium AZCC 2161]
MKLHQSAASPNSRRVRIYLAEKGIPVPIVPIDLGKKEQFTDAYRAVNPRSLVPTLELSDGTAIGEVLAIWRYLEETNPEPALLGSSAKDKALVTMWERRMELEGFAAVMEAVRNSVAGLKGRALAGPHFYEQIPELAERSKLRVLNFYDDLNTRLGDTPFIAGDRYSVADITGLVTVDFATNGANLPVPDDHASLKRWYAAIASRPSAAA